MQDPVSVAREVLVQVARKEETIGYWAAAQQINERLALSPPLQARDDRLFDLLGKVSTQEVMAGRPMLSAVVVRVREAGPGMGFFDLARNLARHGLLKRKFTATAPGRARFWLEELDRVYEAHKPPDSSHGCP